VGDRVDEPRCMKARDGAQKRAPQQEGESADREQHDPEDNCRCKMVLCEPDVDLIPGQIRDVAFECRYVLAQRIANQDPTRMRPPLAIAGRVGIAVLVRELVMLTVRSYPEQRAPFQGRHGTNRKKILKQLGRREGAMDEQPVITYAEPRPTVTQYKKSATNSACHVKKKSAATAPT
jgi:hypothetical protein